MAAVTATLKPILTDSGLGERDVQRAMHRLRMRRVALGLTQAAVADALGTTQSAISDWEVGVTNPTAHSMARLARLYGLRLAMVESAIGEGGQP